ncbi:MAG: UbiA family prenyltransferase [Hyphomicrobium sp.]|jgi:4-hydroxybenzoate polyprenyltransferase
MTATDLDATFRASAGSVAGSDERTPLAVDLDGTLAKSDGLIDAVAKAVLRTPKHIPTLLGALMRGRLAFKSALADLGSYQPQSIPLREDLVAYLQEQKAAGRALHLITASPQEIADAVAARVQAFDSAVGSRDGLNLKGPAKARYLQEQFPDGFSYAGNDRSDLEVWRHASSAITVAAPVSVERAVAKLGVPVERSFKQPRAGIMTWLRLLRMHQWSKNVLMFVPLALAHRYGDAAALLQVALAFLCMGFVASATYIINDLSDLDADRRHATKRYRPLASAEISVGAGIVVAVLLGMAGMTGALLLDRWFALALGVYVALTLAYSLRLKAIALLDVFVLGLLYTLRIVMGIVLLHVPPSPWLLVFSLFFFFSLSMAKRHVEIVRAFARGETGRIKGRGYLGTDAPLTLSLGVSSTSVAVMLLFLYVANDAYPVGVYRHPQWLWVISPLVFLWTTRIWLKSHRGRLDDDPINFALRDPPSLLLGVLVVLAFALAAFWP